MNFLIQNAKAIFDSKQSLSGLSEHCDLRVRDGVIAELGRQLTPAVDETLYDATDWVIYPGMVNTHHHLAQSVLKGIPEGLNQPLGDWLAAVPYRFWPHISADLMYDAALIGLAELLRSGATTCADHHYLYHANSTPEVEEAVWQAASDLGIRFVLCSGSANVAGSHKGMQKAGIVPESIDQILARYQRSLQQHHQAKEAAMKKLVIAPTSLIHSCTPDCLTVLAEFARTHKLGMHSHLLEVAFDNEQAQQKYGLSPVNYANSVGWLGDNVWFAHLVSTQPDDIALLAETGTNIAHCPTSNCRLGSGVAPVLAMQSAGMKISLGVDGSASAESGSMIQETNLAWLLHRALHGASSTQATQCVDWASRNGAEVLGYNNLGSLSVGMLADIVAYDVSHYRYQGVHTPALAPVLAGEPVQVARSWVNGNEVVVNGQVKNLDTQALTQRLSTNLQRLLHKTGVL
ncbi:amidohydrolase family protein [Alteromonas lipolytica]|uniref:Amidohydrolase n=1 Tax=Alteromonas lipolytica TaxID=1856405 RepID=A0A1E8FJ39_9ALTE|nr:amidohydrolase family protein [Alteromonas lipolytica]OFI35947.1 amidohydrolase [Alteromonas lipolytica]GGF72313.1 8-oxoguanine deaminase [Alteromonas lipolytica]